VTNHTYQRNIGLGPGVVSLVLEVLQREPDHWIWALRKRDVMSLIETIRAWSPTVKTIRSAPTLAARRPARF